MLALKSGDEDRRDMIISLNPQSRLPFPWVNGQLKIGLEAVSAEMGNSGLACLSSAEVSKGFVSAVEPLGRGIRTRNRRELTMLETVCLGGKIYLAWGQFSASSNIVQPGN